MANEANPDVAEVAAANARASRSLSNKRFRTGDKLTRLVVRDDKGTDITNDCTLESGKASLMWSQYEVHYAGQRIGWIEAGSPEDFHRGYTWEEVPA